MSAAQPGLYLVSPALADAETFRTALEKACAAASPVAILLRLAAADERTLVNRVKMLAPVAQAVGAAVIVADPGGEVDLVALAMRGGADGAHAATPARLHELCERLKDGRNIGAGGLASKHDAMVAGEMGVDYVMFGEPRPDGTLPRPDLVRERAEWWAEIFQVPCVVFAPDLDAIPDLVRTGADFIAVGDAVWDHPGGPEAGILAALEAMHAEGVEA